MNNLKKHVQSDRKFAYFPLHVEPERAVLIDAPYFAEEVRRKIADLYGEASLYKGGLTVTTTVNPKLQEFADKALRKGLEEYDRRHGWRGSLGTIH